MAKQKGKLLIKIIPAGEALPHRKKMTMAMHP
jgi:hypothetical protein